MYQTDTSDCLKQLDSCWQTYQHSLIEVNQARDKSFQIAEEVEKIEIQIEVQMSQTERGDTWIEKVQKISQKGN